MADLWTQKSARLRGEAALMPTIVDFPTIVKDAVDIFATCLPTNRNDGILPNT